VLCPSCSYLYKATLGSWSRPVLSWQSVPASISDHPRLFLTLTALVRHGPRRKSDGSCQPGRLRFCNTAASSPVRDTTTTPTRRSAVRSVILLLLRDACSGTRSLTSLEQTFEQIRRRLAIALASLLKSSHSTPD